MPRFFGSLRLPSFLSAAVFSASILCTPPALSQVSLSCGHEATLTASDSSGSDAFAFDVDIDGDTVIVGSRLHDPGTGSMTGAAYVYVRSGGVWTEEDKLLAVGGLADDNFGHSVAISGDTAVVGAWGHDANGGGAGAAYVFTRSGSSWSQDAILLPGTVVAGDSFGWDVAIDGDSIVVSAHNQTDLFASQGAVYVFVPDLLLGGWMQQARLTAMDAGLGGDALGVSVAIDGDTLVAGAPRHDHAGADAGAAYVFVRDPLLGTWTEEAEVSALDATLDDLFGSDVAVSGDALIVGVLPHDHLGADSGAAYIFRRDMAMWTQEAEIFGSDADPGEQFGYSVDIQGDLAIVGDNLNGMDTGSLYVFAHDGGVWQEQTVLVPDNPTPGNVGQSSALDGGTIVTGDYSAAQAVYVFSCLVCVETAELLANDGAIDDSFGFSVAVDGDFAAVGAPFEDANGTDSGSAYVFERSGGTWPQIAKVTAFDGADGDRFGRSLDIDGNTLAVGAHFADAPGTDSGAVYVFVDQGVFVLEAKVTAIDSEALDSFGFDVAIDGDTLVVGSPLDDDDGLNSGSVYVFERTGSVQKLTAPTGAAGDRFGWSVDIVGDRLIAGAIFDDDMGVDAGAAYTFTRPPAGSWTYEQTLTASDGAAGDEFGRRVALAGDRAVVTAPLHDDNGADSGAAYAFVYTGSWTQEAELLDPSGAAGDEFGSSVDLISAGGIVGSFTDEPAGILAGSASFFGRFGTNWSQTAKFTASDGAASDLFGRDVAVSGTTLVVGAQLHDHIGDDAGAAYVFECLPLESLLDILAALAGAADGLNEGQRNALQAKLDGIAAKIAEGNTKAACGKLGAFVNQVEALLEAGVLDAAEAQGMLDIAGALACELGCASCT
jgi:hypothetical protein